MRPRPFEFLKSVFGGGIEQKSISLTDPLAYSLFGVTPTIAGPSINPATALRVPAVYSAIVLITGTIGSLPAKVFETANSGKRTANDHPAYRLVHREANDWTSAGELRARLTRDALLHSQGGFAFANRVNDRVVEFIRLDPTTMSVKADATTGEPVYEQRDDSTIKHYDYRDILHIPAPLDLAPIVAGREAIGVSSILERHAAQLFANGARPSAILSKEGKAGVGADGGATVTTNMRKAWRNWQANGNGDPLILDDGWTYTQAALSSVDAQFLEMRVHQIGEIARLFRVPPHMLFELSRATWSNAEEMFQSFLTLTLRPWLDVWEWAYARVLLTPEERDTLYIEFVTDDLITADAETRALVYGQYRAMGALTANEVRAGLNRAPKDGGDTLDNPNITPGKRAGQNDNTAAKAAA